MSCPSDAGFVMTLTDDTWVPMLHCTACLKPVGAAGLVLWNPASELTAAPAIVCSQECGDVHRANVPELALEQMELSLFMFMILLGTATTGRVSQIMNFHALGKAIRAIHTDGGAPDAKA